MLRVLGSSHPPTATDAPLPRTPWGRAAGLFGLLLMCSLQGCLLTRIMETRAQLCDEQPPRVVIVREPGAGLRVRFESPTLTDRDVVWIVGFEPSEIASTSGVRELTYEARPVQRPSDPATHLLFQLSFHSLQGKYRLSELRVPEKLSIILPPVLLDAAVKIACKAQIVVVPPRTTLDLTDVDRATLPTRDGLRKLLGPPTAVAPGTHEISYQYCLAPCEAQPSMVANFRFAFDMQGQMERVEASYFRYSAVVDLLSSRPTATVELH